MEATVELKTLKQHSDLKKEGMRKFMQVVALEVEDIINTGNFGNDYSEAIKKAVNSILARQVAKHGVQ